MRIKVIWLGGKAWDFKTNTKDAYEMVSTLKQAGFADAAIDWRASDVS